MQAACAGKGKARAHAGVCVGGGDQIAVAQRMAIMMYPGVVFRYCGTSCGRTA